MKVHLPSTKPQVDRRLGAAVAFYILVQSGVTAFGYVAAPMAAALVTAASGVVLALGALRFEIVKAQRGGPK